MDINKFKQYLGYGVRANLFKVELTFPSISGISSDLTEKFTFLCKAASQPSSNIGKIEIPYQGRMIPVPGDRTFEEYSVTVLNDAKYDLRDAFERWHNAIDQFEEHAPQYDYDSLMVEMKFHQLDRSKQVIKTYTFTSAWPTVVGNIDVSSDSNDSVEEFQVTFAYLLWKSNTTS